MATSSIFSPPPLREAHGQYFGVPRARRENLDPRCRFLLEIDDVAYICRLPRPNGVDMDGGVYAGGPHALNSQEEVYPRKRLADVHIVSRCGIQWAPLSYSTEARAAAGWIPPGRRRLESPPCAIPQGPLEGRRDIHPDKASGSTGRTSATRNSRMYMAQYHLEIRASRLLRRAPRRLIGRRYM